MSTRTIMATITATATLTHEPARRQPAAADLARLAGAAGGGFSYSEGLEAAVDAGLVRSEAQAADWLAQQLHLTLARADLPVLAQALAAWRADDAARALALNDWVLQTRESAELRLQTEQMGRSLLALLATVQPARAEQAARALRAWGAGDAAPSYPVMYALAAADSQAPARDALLAYAFGWAENLMQAALKAVPLGQSAGQRILARLAAEIPAAVDDALARADNEARQAFSPMLAILSARHETQYSRLFRS